ncbi:uncharacterized protein LOC143024110 [Oratosquilla oratoria]|uniref:uncharacterized protein LOC143024110 n=1 Tax=Oratosquilla oratoria TaxID=337810 RepID=UPI003F7591B0
MFYLLRTVHQDCFVIREMSEKIDYCVVEYADTTSAKDTKWCENAAKRKLHPGEEWRSYPIKPIHYRNFDWSAAWSKFRRLEEHSEVESTDDENLGRSKRSIRSPKRYDPDSANIQRRGHSPSPPMPPLPHTNKYKRIRDQNVSDSEDEIDQSSDTTSLPLPPPQVNL